MERPSESGACDEPASRLHQLFQELLPPSADAFARSRLQEGVRTLDLVRRLFPGVLSGRPRVLDLGSGNGGMLFPFAREGFAVAVDTYIDPDLRRFKTCSGLPVAQIRATAEALPVSDSSLDLVLMAEVVEHLAAPRRAAREVMRVLRPGGVCLLSTPPRLRFLTRPDPHFGIRYLLALPDRFQRRVEGWLRPADPASVHHVYATTWGLHRLFPRGSCSMHVISHRRDWTRNFSWNYVAFRKDCG